MRDILNTHCRRIAGDCRGVSAVEFALIAPLLVAMILGVVEIATYVTASTSMDRAVRSGAQYVMNGGTDAVVVQEIVRRSWLDAPEKFDVTVETNCLCGGVAVSCSTTSCSGGGRPEIYTEINASGSFSGMFHSYSRKTERTIRVQ